MLVGVGSAAAQIEEDLVDTRENDWGMFSRLSMNPAIGGGLGAVGNRGFARGALLARTAAAAGFQGYRFSIEWARCQPYDCDATSPSSPPPFDDDALRAYRSIVEAALENPTTKVHLTLFHYTTPAWFARRGGWLRQDAPLLFALYAEKVAQVFRKGLSPKNAHRVDFCTGNEMNVCAWGVVSARVPAAGVAFMHRAKYEQLYGPMQDDDALQRYENHLILAHVLARQKIRRAYSSSDVSSSDVSSSDVVGLPAQQLPRVGLSVSVQAVAPDERDAPLSQYLEHWMHFKFLRGLLNWKKLLATDDAYKEVFLDDGGGDCPALDFVGVQSYTLLRPSQEMHVIVGWLAGAVVSGAGLENSYVFRQGLLRSDRVYRDAVAYAPRQTTSMNYAYEPAAARHALDAVAQWFHGQGAQVPLLVTETGIATPDDEERIEYLMESFRGVKAWNAEQRKKKKLPCDEFYVWCIEDNWEWHSGWPHETRKDVQGHLVAGPQFGLCERPFCGGDDDGVDVRPKASFCTLAQLLKTI